jgi:hypothetical protein
LQFLLAFSVALGRYINFLDYTLQPYLVAMAYETDARNPQTPFEGKASNEWVSELTAGQLVEPSKTSKRTPGPFSRSVILPLVSQSLFITEVSVVHRKRHALGRAHY